MLLDEMLKKTGMWLFRYRSYTILALLPVLAAIVLLEYDNFSYVFPSPTMDYLYVLLCLVVALAGEAVRVLTVGFIPDGTSGRNTSSHKASVLNTSGVYSIVRNPLYLGNFLIFLGFSMLFRTWEIAILNVLFFAAAYIPIIYSEEQFLLEKFGDSYRDYSRNVPCFLPKPSRWRSPHLHWDMKMVIRREHDTVYSIVLLFVLLEVSRQYLVTRSLQPSMAWLVVGGVATAMWLVAEFLKKFTNVLKSR